MKRKNDHFKNGEPYWFPVFIVELGFFVADESVWWGEEPETTVNSKGLAFDNKADCEALCAKYNEAIKNIM